MSGAKASQCKILSVVFAFRFLGSSVAKQSKFRIRPDEVPHALQNYRTKLGAKIASINTMEGRVLACI